MSVSKAIYEYYQIMQKTVELGGFQVLAHLDFPKLFFDKWVIDDDVLDMILSTMIDKNILLEVNTSSLNDSYTCFSWWATFSRLSEPLAFRRGSFSSSLHLNEWSLAVIIR